MIGAETGRRAKGRAVGQVAYIESWAAVMLDGPDGGARRFGACLDEGVIPAGHRRRLGPFGRMAVTCGLSLSGNDSSDLIFCSRYGDLDLAFRLMKDLAAGAILSPAGFSLSVHNAVPGVMDLVRKSRVGHTAIAAGPQSFSAGLAEAWGKLFANPTGKVALVFAEAALPDDLRRDDKDERMGMALAMTLSAHRPECVLGRITLEDGLLADHWFEAPPSEMLAERFIADLDAETGDHCHWRSRGLVWSFKAGHDAGD